MFFITKALHWQDGYFQRCLHRQHFLGMQLQIFIMLNINQQNLNKLNFFLKVMIYFFDNGLQSISVQNKYLHVFWKRSEWKLISS